MLIYGRIIETILIFWRDVMLSTESKTFMSVGDRKFEEPHGSVTAWECRSPGPALSCSSLS